MRGAGSKGQFIVGGVAFLATLLIVIQAMVLWTEQNTGWTKKAMTSDRALNAANAGLQHGYWTLAKQNSNWETVQAGGRISGYRFDRSYTDNDSGTYTVSIDSVAANQVKITAIGRASADGELRAIQAVYTRSSAGSAVSAGGAFSLSGSNFQIEWGPVSSPQALVTAGRAHPQFYSAQGVDVDGNGPAGPNCDAGCLQWHSYAPVAASPAVDLQHYKAAAQAAGTYYNSAQTWKSRTLPDGVYYVDGDLTVQTPGNYIQGSLIVMGSLNLPNGAWGTGEVDMAVPPEAWRQYGNDWDYYRTNFDPAAPAAFPGIGSEYAPVPGLVKNNKNVFLKGFLYVGGGVTTAGGGGSSAIYGAAIVAGSANLWASSSCAIYYSPDTAAAIRYTSGVAGGGSDGYLQTAWTETTLPWPAGL